MEKQQYGNHVKYYAPHHFIFLPLMGICIMIGLVKAYNDTNNWLLWGIFSFISLCILYLSIMLRQHYALGNQDRIVRLEFRLRYFQLYGKPSGPVERQLSFSQIAALRFAGDEELAGLLEKALSDNLSGNEIKRSIKNWQPDDMRV